MRFLEIRRHSIRAPTGSELTHAGISFAQRLGEDMGPFARVVTSPLSRAKDTAVAMGFTPQVEWEILLPPDGKVCTQVPWDSTFAEFGAAVLSGGPAEAFASQLAARLNELAASLRDGDSALVIAHGGTLELAAVGCFPLANHREWGGAFGFCEGVRLAHDGNEFVSVEILRVLL